MKSQGQARTVMCKTNMTAPALKRVKRKSRKIKLGYVEQEPVKLPDIVKNIRHMRLGET